MRPVTLLVLGFCLAHCAAKPWRGTDELIAGLRCGMAESDLQAYARKFRGLRTKQGERSTGPTLVAQKGNTLIFLWLPNDRLEAYQVTWSYPLTNQAWGLKHNLCSSQKFVSLQLVGPSSLAGAEVLLDEKMVGELSSAGTMSLDVPLGKHRVVVRSDHGTWSADLMYNEQSTGYDRRDIRLTSL